MSKRMYLCELSGICHYGTSDEPPTIGVDDDLGCHGVIPHEKIGWLCRIGNCSNTDDLGISAVRCILVTEAAANG